ncbi:MAG: cupredoxin domain-containing protein [Bacteroidota bacterium]
MNGRTLLALLVISALIAMAACQAPDEPEPVVDDPQVEDPGIMDPARADTITVELADFLITMPESIPAGRRVFRIVNTGDVEHSLVVEGPDVELSLEETLAPGEQGRLEVDLPPGDYEAYCPVADHAERGMRTTLRVTEGHADAPGAASPPPENPGLAP